MLSNVLTTVGEKRGTQGQLPELWIMGPRTQAWQAPSSQEQLEASGQWGELSRGSRILFSEGREGFLEEET